MAWIKDEESVELAIAIPHTGNVSFNWATKLSSLRVPDHIIASQSTAPIDLAREKTIENASEKDPEWILMLDSDVIPPQDVYERLIEHDLDIVSATYVVDKATPHISAWVYENSEGLSPIMEWREDALLNVDAVGLGCCLVNSRVFDDIDRPWFRWTEGYESHPWDMKGLDSQKGVGEDFYFCHKAQEQGYNVYVDTSVQCLHEKPGVHSVEGFQPVAQVMRSKE